MGTRPRKIEGVSGEKRKEPRHIRKRGWSPKQEAASVVPFLGWTNCQGWACRG
jgi:hypothetical protein